jgi:hypothetical protein
MPSCLGRLLADVRNTIVLTFAVTYLLRPQALKPLGQKERGMNPEQAALCIETVDLQLVKGQYPQFLRVLREISLIPVVFE